MRIKLRDLLRVINTVFVLIVFFMAIGLFAFPSTASAAGFTGRQLVATAGTNATASGVVTNSSDDLKGQIDRIAVVISGYASPTGSFKIVTDDGLVVATNSFTSATTVRFTPRIYATDAAGSSLTGTASGTNVTIVNSAVVPVSFSGKLNLLINRCNDTGVVVTANTVLITN